MGADTENQEKSVEVLQEEIQKRKEWFFECQLRKLYLEAFRDVIVTNQFPDPLLKLISESWDSVGFPSAQAGSRFKQIGHVYTDSKQPVWTVEEREQRNPFTSTFIGQTVNWLDYKSPVKLAANLARIKEQYESKKFGSVFFDEVEFDNFGREDPSLAKENPTDRNRLSHAISRIAITEKRPWLIPEIFNSLHPDMFALEKWIANGEDMINNYEFELNEILGKNKIPPQPFTPENPDAYRTWVTAILKKSLTTNSTDAVRIEFLDKSTDTWKFSIQIETSTLPLRTLDEYFSGSVKYWIDTSSNPLEEIYINKADSDMGLCLIMRTLYLYGILPEGLAADKKLRWRNRTAPGPDFNLFFELKEKQAGDNQQLKDRLQTLQKKLQILLEQTAAIPRSAALQFSPVAQEIIKQDILRYKFWLDESFSPYYNNGNPADEKKLSDYNRVRQDIGKARKAARDEEPELFTEKEFWSENHYIMFASSEYLAGQLWEKETFQPARDFLKPDGELKGSTAEELSPVLFGDSSGKLTGRQRMERGRARVLKWLNNKLMFGWAEFNSSGYYREHLGALLNLVDFSLDDEVQMKAKMVTDLLFFDVVRFSHKGSMGAAGGRSQFKSKCAGWDNGLGDVVEIMLGTRGMFVNREGDIGCFFATSTYKVPDVLLLIGKYPPSFSVVDRSRVSISFEEASKYGIHCSKKSDQKDSIEDAYGPKRAKHFSFLETINKEIARTHFDYGAMEDNTIFWWTLSAFYNKQVVRNTFGCVRKYSLQNTGVFAQLQSIFEVLPFFIRLKDLSLAGLPVIGGIFFNDVFRNSLERTSDDVSIFLEGSTRTRANIHTYRNRDVMLSSIQNFRSGQLNYQSNVNQATIANELNIFTTSGYPGLNISNLPFTLGGALAGALTAYTFGVAGAAGAVVGGVGGVLANELALDGENIFGSEGDGPGWWTGYWSLPMVVQSENASIIAYDFHWIQKRLTDTGSHAWFPKSGFDITESRRSSAYEDDNFALLDITDIGPKGFWMFGKKVHKKDALNPDADEEGYVGVFSNQRPKWLDKDSDIYTTQIEKEKKETADFSANDLFADRDWYVEGKNIWIIQVGNKKDYGSFEKFKDRVSSAKVVLDDVGDMECSYAIPNKDGSSQTLSLKYGDGGKFHLNGNHFQTDLYPRFETFFIRGGLVEWGQKEYVIEYKGKSLTHEFSTMEEPARTENKFVSPADLFTVRALIIYLKTEDEEMEIFTVATATVNIGCKAVAVDEVIAAGQVEENTSHEVEWIFFDMPAIANPDMTIDVAQHAIAGKGDEESEWKMTYTLRALMGNGMLKQCTVRPIPLDKFYLKDKNRNTGPVPFSVQLLQWRNWRMLGNTSHLKSWVIAGQPENDLFYFDYIDMLAIDKDRILRHRTLGPCATTSPWTDLNGNSDEPSIDEKDFCFFPFSTRPNHLFLFLITGGSLFGRWLFPGDTWKSNTWTKLEISYQPMIKPLFSDKAIPDTAALPISVPLGVESCVAAALINSSTIQPAVWVSGSDGNFYASSKWPLQGSGNWRKIETAPFFNLQYKIPFQIAGNYLFGLDTNSLLWLYSVKPGEEDILASWQHLPVNDFIIQSFTVAVYGEGKLLVIICSTNGEVWAIKLNEGQAFTGWHRVGDKLNFKISPNAKVSCTSAAIGRVDIFVYGIDNKLYTTWWNEESGWENGHDWKVVALESHEFKTPDIGDIKAISRVNGQIEIYATDAEKNIWKNWWS